ncbi:UNVERIFIED_CONTAM: hypothetical protein GTU68_006300, partial [Idotea baltica]|nr:hypothetical protein [Idotea baltica]
MIILRNLCSHVRSRCFGTPLIKRYLSTEAEATKNERNTKEDIKQLQASLQKLIDTHIVPYVEEWEANEQYPAHKVLKKLGEAGFLGICRPVEYGGLGLDFRYTVAAIETLGTIPCGGIPMSIAVQTDMAIPALARFGSEELKQEFLVPTIAGDVVCCLGVSE